VRAQVAAVEKLGGRALAVGAGLDPAALATLPAYSALIWWGDNDTARSYAEALAKRDGPILPLITGQPDAGHVLYERHLCVDTTAAGGNASLLAGG
jgi:RHH-type proline utilization regulon transcriptional repressor/proline dehydrogenase/delta 1-pyrroline-5-carboxylate dehydrogenase